MRNEKPLGQRRYEALHKIEDLVGEGASENLELAASAAYQVWHRDNYDAGDRYKLDDVRCYWADAKVDLECLAGLDDEFDASVDAAHRLCR